MNWYLQKNTRGFTTNFTVRGLFEINENMNVSICGLDIHTKKAIISNNKNPQTYAHNTHVIIIEY